MTGELSQHDYKNCWLLCKELAQTNSTQSNHSCCCLIFFVCVLWFFTSQSKNQLWSYVDPVLNKDQCVLLKDTMQVWARNSSVSSQALYHRAPFAIWRKCNVVLLPQLCHTGLLVISFAACFFFFFFYIKLCWVAHLSRVIRLPPALWRECNEPVQPPF